MSDISSLVLSRNNQFIVFNKPAGVVVQGDQSRDKALLDLGEIYCKSTLYPVHRIDRPASGCVVFARTQRAAASLSQQFQSGEVSKTYLAVVEQKPDTLEDTLKHYLLKDGRTNKSRVVEAQTPKAKLAQLHYRYITSSDHYHLLEVRIESGRHHQIRAQLAAIGCPVKGDVKYGARRKNADRSIMLHAWQLGFQHPVTNVLEQVTAPLPIKDPLWAFFNEQHLSDGDH